jgi:4-carboxymuconolactone decarboxylase
MLVATVLVAKEIAMPQTDATPRIAPLQPPYPAHAQAFFERIMPKGMDPLVLFRTLGRSERILDKVSKGGLLDPGPVSLRDREIVIDRTCARCGCEYEWGVHTAIFAERVGLDAAQRAALVQGDADDPAWSGNERLLIRLVDELHETAQISDALWRDLATAFSDEQILELIALAGFYHMIAFFCNGLRLPNEPWAPAFADVQGRS